jgi:hypothetical protein
MIIRYRRQLVDLMKHLNLPLVAVEVGVAEANFSRDLLSYGLEKLYSVDNWATIAGQKGDGGFDQDFHDSNYKKAVEKLKPFGEKSVILKGMSNEMCLQVKLNKLGLLYLDAAHDYWGVINDLFNWEFHVVKGGIIAGHDYLNKDYGVREAVHEFCAKRKYEVITIPEDKEEDAGFYFLKH